MKIGRSRPLIRTFLLTLLVFSFSLTPLQKASYRYLADTEKEAFLVALNLIPDGGKPGNICGPLAIQILKDAHLVSHAVPTKSFWFLRPFDKYTQDTILEPAFPKETWDWYFFKESIVTFNFDRFPLLPGDVLFFPYNYDCGGTFSHILVVTRLDENGNPYTVTNHLTDDGWRISELLLYDEGGIKNGYFGVLTDRRNNETIGTTGYCGFYLWRMKFYFGDLPCGRNVCAY
jgi:hypothetical protein